ncbi:YdcH family protein [Parasalinivibrio latis]|uniref:YdcH family protein n=1 Tax=Parasalinivibrio latis TaxID=2952610 RepID=UPI0030E1C28D
MQGENHALVYEFPEYKDKILALKESDTDFQEQAKEYHKLDHKIRGLESANIPTDDQHFNELRLRRAQLKDAIHERLKNGA